MKPKIYTVGQVAKLHKAPLSKIYLWGRKIQKKVEIFSSSHGVVPIKPDRYHRLGFPEKLAKAFPKVPSKKTIEKLIKEVDKTYRP